MPTEVYEIIAQGARYWFLFLMALIVWRSFRWYRKDRRQYKKRLRLLPDAGYVGELVTIRGNAQLAHRHYPASAVGRYYRLRARLRYFPACSGRGPQALLVLL